MLVIYNITVYECAEYIWNQNNIAMRSQVKPQFNCAGRSLQPRPFGFRVTIFKQKRSETGCKPVPAE